MSGLIFDRVGAEGLRKVDLCTWDLRSKQIRTGEKGKWLCGRIAVVPRCRAKADIFVVECSSDLNFMRNFVEILGAPRLHSAVCELPQ